MRTGSCRGHEVLIARSCHRYKMARPPGPSAGNPEHVGLYLMGAGLASESVPEDIAPHGMCAYLPRTSSMAACRLCDHNLSQNKYHIPLRAGTSTSLRLSWCSGPFAAIHLEVMAPRPRCGQFEPDRCGVAYDGGPGGARSKAQEIAFAPRRGKSAWLPTWPRCPPPP